MDNAREEFVAFKAKVETRLESHDDQLNALRRDKHEDRGQIKDLYQIVGRLEARLQHVERRLLGWGSLIYLGGLILLTIVQKKLG